MHGQKRVRWKGPFRFDVLEEGWRSGRFTPQRWPPQENSWMWLLWSAFQQQREPATTALPEVTATKTQRKNNGRAAELRGTYANELRNGF